jgi:hypothetical protein
VRLEPGPDVGPVYDERPLGAARRIPVVSTHTDALSVSASEDEARNDGRPVVGALTPARIPA